MIRGAELKFHYGVRTRADSGALIYRSAACGGKHGESASLLLKCAASLSGEGDSSEAAESFPETQFALPFLFFFLFFSRGHFIMKKREGWRDGGVGERVWGAARRCFAAPFQKCTGLKFIRF